MGAAWQGNLAAVQALIDAGSSVDMTASWTTDTSYGSRFAGVTPLHIVSDIGHIEVGVALIRAGADANMHMSHVEMGYHMGEGKYCSAWTLAQRSCGEEGVCRLKVALQDVEAAKAEKPSQG